MSKYQPPYSQERKEAVLTRLLPPNPEPIKDVAVSENISEPTLRNWLDERLNEADPGADATSDADTSSLTSSQKFLVVMETAAMDELQLGEYARSKGLYVADIKRWIENCRQCNTAFKVEDEPVKVSGLRKELRDCRSEINKKEAEIERLNKVIHERDKTIAEESAIIFLQKKTFRQT